MITTFLKDPVEIESKSSVTIILFVCFKLFIDTAKHNTAEFANADLHFIYDHPSVSQPKELTDQSEIQLVISFLFSELTSTSVAAWKKLEPVLIRFLREEQKKEDPYQFVWDPNNV